MLCESLNWPFRRLQHLIVVFSRHWTSKPALCTMHESQNGSDVTYQINIANSSFATLRNSKFPRDVWQAEASLSSMVLRSEEWLVSQSRLAVADSKDPLLRPKNDSDQPC